MKTLYIHIGTGKTGTTAIQNFCALNEKVLRDKYSLIYSSSCRLNNNHHLTCFNWFELGESYEYKKEKVTQALENVVNELLCSDKENILISSEYFPGVEKKELEDIYIPFFEGKVTVKVIAYIRRQDEYLESWFAQLIKTEQPHADIHVLMKTLRNKKLLDHSYMINKWSSLIGENNIIVRPYEKCQFKNGNLIHDFLSIFDIEESNEFLYEEKEANTSLSRDQIVLIKSFYNAGLDKFVDDVIKKPFDFDASSSKYFLPPSERDALINEYSVSNSLVAKNFLNRKDGRLFYAPLPSEFDKSWSSPEQPATEFMLRAFTHLLSKQARRFEKEIELLKSEVDKLKEK